MKRVAVMLAEGFEEIEALTVADVLRRARVECDMISIGEISVKGAHNIEVKADKIIDDDLEEYDMIVCPGGLPGAKYLSENQKLIEVIQKFDKIENKFISAICAAPAMVLTSAGIEKDKFITSYPGEEFEEMLEDANYTDELVVVNGNLITSRGPATALLFAFKLLDVLGIDSSRLKEGMLWNLVEKENDETN